MISIASRQNGFAGFLLLALVVVAAVTSFMGFASVRSDNARQQREGETRAALTAAREALLAFALSRPDRGHLPCPADPAPASPSEEGRARVTCDTAGKRIGRLPWRTLGIAEPRDAYGESLWYAVSDDVTDAALRINSAESPGQLSVNGAAGFAAIVLSSGNVTGTQIRDPALASCTTSGENLPGTYCATNYLDVDAVSGISNADSDTTFVRASGEFFNDQLAELTAAQFFARVEKRVLATVKDCLNVYAAAHGNRFPWAHKADSSGVRDTSTAYDDDVNEYIGRVADDVNHPTPYTWSASCPLPHAGAKNWLYDWRELVFYAVAPDFVPGGPATTGTLTVGSQTNVRAAILIAGATIGSQIRTTESDQRAYQNYLEGNNQTTFPSSPQTWDVGPATSTFNDRVVVVAHD